MLNKTIKRKLLWIFLFSEPLKRVRMLLADRFTKTFSKLPRGLMEGMELKLCFVTSLLS